MADWFSKFEQKSFFTRFQISVYCLRVGIKSDMGFGLLQPVSLNKASIRSVIKKADCSQLVVLIRLLILPSPLVLNKSADSFQLVFPTD